MNVQKKLEYLTNLYSKVKERVNGRNSFYYIASEDFSKKFNLWSVDGVGRFCRRYDFWEKLSAKNVTIPEYEIDDSSSSNKRTFEEKGNFAEGEVYTKMRPTTLEQILELFEVDGDIWEVDRYIINSWDVTNRAGDVFTNYQIKVWLIRKIPVHQEFPTISKVVNHISLPYRKLTLPKDAIKRALIVADTQIGFTKDIHTGTLTAFHDRKALDIVLQMAQLYNPNLIVLMGDMLDLAAWSTHFIKSPEFYWTTQPALVEYYWWLSKLRMICPNTEIFYMEGNHESRIPKTIVSNAIEAYQIKPANEPENIPITSMTHLLALDELGITYMEGYPKNNYWINDNLEVYHGDVVINKSGETVKRVINDTRNSKIIAHGHRMELASKTVHPKGKTVTYLVFMIGTLAKLDGTVPSAARQENWQQGFCVVDYEDGNGLFEVHPIYINNGYSMFKGMKLQGKDYTKDLNTDTQNKWKF